jgi:thiamine pyrophosphate-dependent acetolactate synthase large subunit-like protein
MNRAFTVPTNGKPGPIYSDVPSDVGWKKLIVCRIRLPIEIFVLPLTKSKSED